MKQLKFPSCDFSIKRDEDQLFIFDEVRKKWIVLTPEEWVRQHVVFYLVGQKNYPASLIAIEKSIKVNTRTKRFDIACYNSLANPIVLIECKAPDVSIDRSTMEQALRYNSKIQAPCIVLTNGLDLVCALIDFNTKKVSYISDIPDFNSSKIRPL